MTDEIQPGDVVLDLTQNAKMHVLEQTTKTVAEYNDNHDFDLSSYKVHPQLRVTQDEPVYACVYLPGELASPNGTYDFPESRLARIPVEEANEDAVRPQQTLRVMLARRLLTAYDNIQYDDGVHTLEIAIENVLGEELAGLVFELQDVEERFSEVEHE